MARLVVSRLAKAFGGKPILDGVDLDVASGALVALLGGSGGGKTTLLRLICGFERADSGSIAIDGATVSGPHVHLPPEKRRVGYVTQDGSLFPHLTVAANVLFGLPRAERRDARRAAALLESVGLRWTYANRAPHELSGGEQQRVALARTLAPRPSLVLLDEPFSALDAALRAETRAAVANALSVAGATALLVTHDQSEALAMGQEVAVLRDGAIAQAGSPETLYRSPVDIAMARFVGEAVVLPGVVLRNVVATALGTLPLAAPAPDGPVDVMVRPEQIRIEAPLRSDGVPATVLGVTFHGHDASVTLAVEGGGEALTSRVPGHAVPAVADVVRLRVDGAAMAYPRGTPFAGDRPTAAAGLRENSSTATGAASPPIKEKTAS